MPNHRQIYCENPFDKMWNLFLYFHHEETTKRMLYQAYQTEQGEKEAKSLAYQNTLKFIYLLKQGASYFQAAGQSELMVQPLLLYYGITSFMKALILIYDPFYPSSTTILQHGLSTRKKKKNDYQFMEDIVKIQKDGLLPHFSKMVLNQPTAANSKFKVVELYRLIPELQENLYLLFESRTMLPIQIERLDNVTWKFSFSAKDLETEQLHFSAIYELFQAGVIQHKENITILDQELTILLRTKQKDYQPTHDHAQIFEDYKGNFHFFFKHPVPLMQDIMIYNMLMYMLGMLCRYDSEYWGEILYSFHTQDLFLIKQFLQITLRKFPNLVLNYLYRENLIFKTL